MENRLTTEQLSEFGWDYKIRTKLFHKWKSANNCSYTTLITFKEGFLKWSYDVGDNIT